jgi:hypothetical protein
MQKIYTSLNPKLTYHQHVRNSMFFQIAILPGTELPAGKRGRFEQATRAKIGSC